MNSTGMFHKIFETQHLGQILEREAIQLVRMYILCTSLVHAVLLSTERWYYTYWRHQFNCVSCTLVIHTPLTHTHNIQVLIIVTPTPSTRAKCQASRKLCWFYFITLQWNLLTCQLAWLCLSSCLLFQSKYTKQICVWSFCDNTKFSSQDYYSPQPQPLSSTCVLLSSYVHFTLSLMLTIAVTIVY